MLSYAVQDFMWLTKDSALYRGIFGDVAVKQGDSLHLHKPPDNIQVDFIIHMKCMYSNVQISYFAGSFPTQNSNKIAYGSCL